MAKFTFSGHDSFECRHFWLKKGFDHVVSGGKFNDEAVVPLGVGRNMVNSIRHWMKAYALLNEKEELTDFANLLFGENGFDPYLEDEASLWLLHFHLVTNEFASLYSLIFNELRIQKPEFSKEHAFRFVQTQTSGVNENTFSKDFEAFTKTYVTKGPDAEENFDGILTELNLVEEINRNKKGHYVIKNEDRKRIPVEIILYCICLSDDRKSIDFDSLLQNKNSIGTVFAFTKESLADKLDELSKKYKGNGVVFSDHAGMKELQFRGEIPAPKEMLNNYYAEIYAG